MKPGLTRNYFHYFHWGVATLLLSGLSGYAENSNDMNPSSEKTFSVLTEKEDFNSKSLYGNSSSGISLGQPKRFSMQQSYSVSFMSGGAGSASSGLYLNTLSYRLSAPLTLSADLGFYTPISSTIPGMRQNTLMVQGGGSSLVFPRVGLEYRPSENFSVNLQLFNGPDARKAYGSSFSKPFWNWFP